MACKIRNLTDSAVQSLITDIVVKTNGLYKPEGTTLTTSAENFSESDLEKMVKDWSIGQYKSTAFTDNWYTVNAGPKEVVVSFAAPTKLIKAYEVKLGLKSLDQANDELAGVEPEALYQESGVSRRESIDLENITPQELKDLEDSVKYSMEVEKDQNLLSKGGQMYHYLNEIDAQRFDDLVKRFGEFPKEFKITLKVTRYEKRENSVGYDSWNEYQDLIYVKLNNNKKSNLYKLVNTDTGMEIVPKIRLLSASKDAKGKIAEDYGLEFKPTKIFSANRSIAFVLYVQKPNKKKYISFAKKYIYDAIKFLPSGAGIKYINLDFIEKFLEAYPEEMWDYINTTYSPEDSTNINASINIQNNIRFKLPKLGLLEAIEKITGIKLQGASFKNYDRTGGVKKVLRVEWGELVTIDYTKLSEKQLRKAISYYLRSKNYFKPSSVEENVRKYAEHNGIDYDKLRELVFGDIDKAIENVAYNTTGNSDEMEVSKWRESIREYDWQSVELFSKPYKDYLKTAKERITKKFKDKTLSNGISHLDYFFTGNFNWLNINLNRISGQYYLSDMETPADVGVDFKMMGFANPFEVASYKKPVPGKTFLPEEEVFNRLAAVLHEPFHALHALSYGTKEELELRKAFQALYDTDFGKTMLSQTFGGTYNKKNVSFDLAYKEFSAFFTQMMLFPKDWINATDLRSNDIYEFYEKIATLDDKQYTEIVKTLEKIGTEEVVVTEEEKLKLTFLQKLYNFLVKALNNIIPLSKKFFSVIQESRLVDKTVIKDVFGEVEKEVVRKVPLPKELRAKKEEFLAAMDDFKNAINVLMNIDTELFSSENIANFFYKEDPFYQESGTPIKPGVQELFNSNPELANQVYEALGFKQTVTQDDKSYYRGQVEQPTIDKDGNLVLYGKEDELYKRAGLKSKGVSMTDDLQSAIEYGDGQLKVSQNLASESYDANQELERLSENGYYLIQIPKNLSNEIVEEANEVKVIGDKIIIPKGQYKIEQVIDGLEQITPQQKQEALEVYSQYLESLNKPNTNPLLQGNQQEQIDESEITYTDENNNPCAAAGLKSSKFQKGGNWEIIKEFKGKSHSQGGIDIEIGNNGIKMSNKQGKFEAKFGLVIPKNN